MLSVLLHLGYGFVRATLGYPFRAGRGGERFLRQFGAEGLWPVSADHRAVAAAFERCLGCGLCELAGGEAGGGPALHDLARSLWRSPLAAEELLDLLDRVDAPTLAEAEASCPAEVPFGALGRALRSWHGRD